MRKHAALLALGAIGMSVASTNSGPTEDDYLNYGKGLISFGGYNRLYGTNPVYVPKKHTIESYRSQQRKAKRRRK